MQHKGGAECPVWERFFGKEVCGQNVTLFPGSPPLGFRSHMAFQAAGKQWWPFARVGSYDEASGCHKLKDGRSFDLTEAFANGCAYFERPLHEIICVSSEDGSCDFFLVGSWD